MWKRTADRKSRLFELIALRRYFIFIMAKANQIVYNSAATFQTISNSVSILMQEKLAKEGFSCMLYR